MKILFCDYQIPVPHTYEKKLIEKEIPGAVFEEYVYEGDEKELYDKVADADAIMTCFLKIDRVLLEHAPKLKMISVDATGYGDVDVEAAKEKLSERINEYLKIRRNSDSANILMRFATHTTNTTAHTAITESLIISFFLYLRFGVLPDAI